VTCDGTVLTATWRELHEIGRAMVGDKFAALHGSALLATDDWDLTHVEAGDADDTACSFLDGEGFGAVGASWLAMTDETLRLYVDRPIS
jgi:hypothetical protein